MPRARAKAVGAGAERTHGRRYGGRTAEERNAERRERLLAAGLEAFGTQGFGSTSIEQLCVAAGVATRNFYDEFESREALLIALHDEINARAFDAAAAALGGSPLDDLEARARAAFGAYLEVMTSDARWIRITIVEMVGATPATHAARHTALRRFSDLLEAEAERLVAAGVLPRRDYSLTAIGVIGALTAMVETLTAEADAAAVDRIETEAVRLLLRFMSDPADS